ncbi:hypothetical protein HRbin21_01608 [bacterium HR21]|nr:hypothetical protein HRbin21_01608 [bacterium HR21]
MEHQPFVRELVLGIECCQARTNREGVIVESEWRDPRGEDFSILQLLQPQLSPGFELAFLRQERCQIGSEGELLGEVFPPSPRSSGIVEAIAGDDPGARGIARIVVLRWKRGNVLRFAVLGVVASIGVCPHMPAGVGTSNFAEEAWTPALLPCEQVQLVYS